MLRVPYRRLRAAEARAAEQHPDATRIKALWNSASEQDIVVEVWHGDRADVIAC